MEHMRARGIRRRMVVAEAALALTAVVAAACGSGGTPPKATSAPARTTPAATSRPVTSGTTSPGSCTRCRPGSARYGSTTAMAVRCSASTPRRRGRCGCPTRTGCSPNSTRRRIGSSACCARRRSRWATPTRRAGRSGIPTASRARCSASTHGPRRSPRRSRLEPGYSVAQEGFGDLWVANYGGEGLARIDPTKV